MMKKIIFGIIALLVAAAGVGLYMYNKPLESTQSMKTDHKIEAASLLTAFEENEMEANTKYLDKVVEVTGQVEKVEQKDGKTTVYLDAGNMLSSVIFQLEEESKDISKNESITLKGICTGYLMDVVLVRGVQI